MTSIHTVDHHHYLSWITNHYFVHIIKQHNPKKIIQLHSSNQMFHELPRDSTPFFFLRILGFVKAPWSSLPPRRRPWGSTRRSKRCQLLQWRARRRKPLWRCLSTWLLKDNFFGGGVVCGLYTYYMIYMVIKVNDIMIYIYILVLSLAG